MPQRPRNARNNKKTTASLRQSQPSTPRTTSPPLSPPTQLPTPLPDEHISVAAHPHLPELMDPREEGNGGEDHGNTSVDTGRLIDFDAPTPPEPPPVLLPDADADADRDSAATRMGFGLLDVEDMDMEGTYRSPPFREARLPGGEVEVEESPPPLSVRPRVPYASASARMAADLRGSGGDTDGRGGGEGRYAGHTRSPTFSRHARSPSASATSPQALSPPLSPPYSSTAAHVAPSTHARSSISSPYTTSPPPPSSMSNSGSASAFENLTRTVRGYVPSPPGASRPVVSVESQASAHGQRRAGGQQQPEYEREYESQEGGGSYVYGYGYAQAQRQQPQAQHLPTRSPPAHQPQAQAQHHPPPTTTYDAQPLSPPAYGYGYGYHQPQPLQPPQRYQALSQHPHQHQRSQSSTSPTTSTSARSVSASSTGRSVPASSARRSVDLTSPTRRTSVTSLSSATGGMGGMGGVGSGLAQAMRRVGSRVTGGRSTSGGGGGGFGGGMGGTGGGGLGIGVGGGRRAAEAGGPRAEKERIVWARWDGMEDRRMLILAYPTGLQIWDCTNLSAINEVLNLNLNSDEWGMLLGAPDLNLSTASIRGGDGKPGVDEEGSSQALRIVHAALLPSPSRRSLGHAGRDAFGEDRPLLGILMDPSDEDERELEPRSTYVLYSLRRHQLVKRLTLPGLASSFTPNEHFIIISTTLPPTLHVLSSSTFHTLHTIASGSLEPFATPLFTGSSTALNLTNLNLASAQSTALSISNAITSTAQSTLSNKPKSVLLAGPGLSIDEDTATMNTNTNAQRQPTSANEPHPVYALSHRLLAYASPSPAASPSLQATLSKASRRLSSSSTATSASASNAPSSVSSSPFGGLGAGFSKLTNISQADVGHAALRVGESVLGGMKLFGGMAFEAAKSRVASGPGGVMMSGDGKLGVGGRPGGGSRYGVSRSAPDNAAAAEEDARRFGLGERRYSSSSSATSASPHPHSHSHSTTVAPSTRPVLENGYYVTVIDLLPLLSSKAADLNATMTTAPRAAPAKIDEFLVSRNQPIASLHFSEDGTSISAVSANGHSLKVFKLRPIPSIMSPSIETGESARRALAAHVYDLRRGRTSAVVEGVDWAKDGRWVALGTRNRTVHVFGVNPYGGKPDIRSHLEGRVRNVDVVEPRMTTLGPLARLRASKATSSEQLTAPLAFTFVSSNGLSASPDLLPPLSPPPASHSPSSPSFSPSSRGKRGANYEHVLVFDPEEGVLSLRRLTLDKHLVREQGIGGVAASVQALGVTSISLPGMGGSGRLSSSPSSAAKTSGPTAAARVVDPPTELGVKESEVATWNLGRERGWEEIKRPMIPSGRGARGPSAGGEWFSEAELSTCSNSARVLPRSLYLSHQFSFHTLGEEYQTLLRRYQFDFSGAKIEVRKAVEISAYASGGGNSAFVEGYSSPRDIRRASSSFDEPLASAISGSFDNSNLPAILPMYPNGIPGSKPKSFRNSIPIRTMAGIGDGVSEGIGRIRRGMHGVRSPQLVARSDSSMSGPVPLEFDEEDEDFLVRDTLEMPGHGARDEASTSRGTSREGASAESSSSLAIATPANVSTHQLMDADVVGTVDEEMFDGWDHQDKLAVEEAEQFHDIAAVGYMDEEREQKVPAPPVLDSTPKRKGRKWRR